MSCIRFRLNHRSTESRDSEYYYKVKKRKCIVRSSKRIEETDSSESDYQKREKVKKQSNLENIM